MNAQDEHRVAVENALHAARELKKLFDALGSSDSPNGKLVRAYRLTRTALRAEMQAQQAQPRRRVANRLLADLRTEVQAALAAEFANAVQLGSAQAQRDLTIYGMRFDDGAAMPATDEALTATLLTVDRQRAMLAAALTTGTLDDAVLGDETRVGVLSFGAVLRDATFWIVALALRANANTVDTALSLAPREIIFKRQAIAALDENTTDCCLRVHGQVVGMNEDFHLTGTPRFADRMKAPPFHIHCRTSTALLRAEVADDDLTRAMRSAAADELRQRELYGRKEINPANALSRRS